MSEKLAIESLALKLEDLPQPVDPRTLFPCQDRPLEVEVGIGKGTFLVEQARRRSDVNFFGIEWANKYYLYAADRCARWGLSNVRLLRTDARAFVEAWLADGCLDALHVYFPDPWPKKRHHKRRFFREHTMNHVVRALRPGGRLFAATDHAEYFETMQAVVLGRSDLEEVPFPADLGGPGEIVGSNFERKYIREGRTFHRLAVRRRA
ncbi:MAG: tRNA (guanine-N(7)-)-methyltransferase [Phycisphaerae bacterium]|nr:tRNA (guanine-N(7)-)-methyltransferase [Phycisphaerae bacterium]